MATTSPALLTVRQPWADFIIPTPATADMILAGGKRAEWAYALPKNVENRARGTAYRGLMLICAGLEVDQAAMDSFRLDPDRFVRGKVIGAVDLADVVSGHPSIWAEQHPNPPKWMRHWVLANPRRIAEPVPARGNTMLVSAPPDVAAAVLAQMQ